MSDEKNGQGFWVIMNHRIFSNPVYFIFILSWLLIHWRFFVTMFFINNENVLSEYGVTKDIYLKHILFDLNHWIISLVVISLPFVFTGIVLYWIQPKFLVVLIEKHKRYEIAKELIDIHAEKELAQARVAKVKAKVAEEGIKAELEAKVKETRDEHVNEWENEFKEFQKNYLYSKFDYIIQAVYEHNGDILVQGQWPNDPPSFKIPKAILAFAHTSDLITMDKVKGKIELTDKGKYFIKRSSS